MLSLRTWIDRYRGWRQERRVRRHRAAALKRWRDRNGAEQRRHSAACRREFERRCAEDAGCHGYRNNGRVLACLALIAGTVTAWLGIIPKLAGL